MSASNNAATGPGALPGAAESSEQGRPSLSEPETARATRLAITAETGKAMTIRTRASRGAWLLLPTLALLSACASEEAIRASDERFGRASAPAPARIVRAPDTAMDAEGRGQGSDAATAPVAGSDDVPLIAGRIAYVGGPARVWDARENNWRDAALNETIGPSSAVRTETGSRMEVVIGTTALRLNSGSSLTWAALDPQHTEVELDSGSLIVSLRSEIGRAPALPASAASASSSAADPGGAADDAPREANGMFPVVVLAGQVAVTLERAGASRFVVDEEGRRLTVRAGADAVSVEHGGTRTVMARGQTLAFNTETGQGLATAAALDEAFLAWSGERDRQAGSASTWQYVSPAMTGADALDGHGDWQVDQNYGPIWYPTTVSAGWAPYRYGRWTWVAPWGWTWVDDAPWGYAPFHYGRWAYVGSRWGWVPGDWVASPVYSPALVGYYGGGASITLSSGAPASIGWFPLAPWEPWYPAYRYSPRYLASVNQPWRPSRYSWRGGRVPAGNYLAPPARYRYAEFAPGATVIPAPRFGAGAIGPRLPLTGDQLRRLPPPSRVSGLPTPPRNGVVAPPSAGAGRFRAPTAQPGWPGVGSRPGFGAGPVPKPDGGNLRGTLPRSPGPGRGADLPGVGSGRYTAPGGGFAAPGIDRRAPPKQIIPSPGAGSVTPGLPRQMPAQRYSPPPQRVNVPPKPALPTQPLPMHRPAPAQLQRPVSPPPAAVHRPAAPPPQPQVRQGPAPRYTPPR